MAKVDFKKELKHLYNPSRKVFSIVDVPSMNFVMIDGHGDPNTAPEYQQAVEALYAVAYGLKFMIKQEQGIDYGVLPLEGLWWVEGDTPALEIPRNEWRWKLLIRMPEFITKELMFSVQPEVAKKKKNELVQKIALGK